MKTSSPDLAPCPAKISVPLTRRCLAQAELGLKPSALPLFWLCGQYQSSGHHLGL